jgi:hypothetical protein
MLSFKPQASSADTTSQFANAPSIVAFSSTCRLLSIRDRQRFLCVTSSIVIINDNIIIGKAHRPLNTA